MASPITPSAPKRGVLAKLRDRLRKRSDPAHERAGRPPRLRSVRRQRVWFLIALITGVASLTGVMLVLGQALAERFATQVQADLEWRALRGASELAKTAELDTALILEALDAYAASPDVEVIAVEVGDKIVASHETLAALAPVFAAPHGTLVRGDGYVASWAAAVAEGAEVGKIAVVVSTRRHTGARALQARVSQLTLIAGAAAAVLGTLVVLLLTRNGVATSPVPAGGVLGASGLAASGMPSELDKLNEQLEERTGELADRNRWVQLLLAHAGQGLLTVDLAGRLDSERSAITERWLGTPAADATLASYLGAHDDALAGQVRSGLERICEGVAPLDECLAQLPRRVTAGAITLEIHYAPLLRDDKPERILLVLGDITEQVLREQKEREAREQREAREVVALTQLITGDRAAFDEFFAEAAGLVASFEAPREGEVERRAVRSLKDNCAYYGLETYVELCQQIEGTIGDDVGGDAMTDEQRRAITQGWARVVAQLAGGMG